MCFQNKYIYIYCCLREFTIMFFGLNIAAFSRQCPSDTLSSFQTYNSIYNYIDSWHIRFYILLQYIFVVYILNLDMYREVFTHMFALIDEVMLVERSTGGLAWHCPFSGLLGPFYLFLLIVTTNYSIQEYKFG